MKVRGLRYDSPGSTNCPPLSVAVTAETSEFVLQKDNNGLISIDRPDAALNLCTHVSQSDAIELLFDTLLACSTVQSEYQHHTAKLDLRDFIAESIASLPVGFGRIDLSELCQWPGAGGNKLCEFVYVGGSTALPTIHEEAPFESFGLVCSRHGTNGEARANIPKTIEPYPDVAPSMDWMSGPMSMNTLAANTLYQLERQYQLCCTAYICPLSSISYLSSFSELFLETMPRAGGRVSLDTLLDWAMANKVPHYCR